MSTTVITWNTHKVDSGYEWRVYTFGYQQPNTTLKSGRCATRAQAMGQAKRWCKWLKSQPRTNLTAQVAALGADSLLPDWQPLTSMQATDARRREGSGFVNPAHD